MPLVVLGKRLQDGPLTGAFIRSASGLTCSVLLVGIPSLMLAADAAGILVVLVLGCMLTPFALFAGGSWSNTPKGESWRCLGCFSCCFVCLLPFLIGCVVVAHVVFLPQIEALLECFCEECKAYCGEYTFDTGYEACPADTFNDANCSLLPDRLDSWCTVFGISLENEESKETPYPCAVNPRTGCVFPIMCHDVAPACYATAEQNRVLRAPPQGDESEGEEVDVWGPCRSMDEFKEMTKWKGLQLTEVFVLLYILFGVGCLCCTLVCTDLCTLRAQTGALWLPIAPSVPPPVYSAYATGAPPAIVVGAMSVGAPVQAGAAGTDNPDKSAGEDNPDKSFTQVESKDIHMHF